jgi:hypothetical protein
MRGWHADASPCARTLATTAHSLRTYRRRPDSQAQHNKKKKKMLPLLIRLLRALLTVFVVAFVCASFKVPYDLGGPLMLVGASVGYWGGIGCPRPAHAVPRREKGPATGGGSIHRPVQTGAEMPCWLCLSKRRHAAAAATARGPRQTSSKESAIPTTSWACERCDKHLCLREEQNCFGEFHAP